MLSVLLRLGLQTDRQHNDQKCEDTKGVICSPNRRRTDNIKTKSVKIPKGLSVILIDLWYLHTFGRYVVCPSSIRTTDNPFGIFTRLVVMLSVCIRFLIEEAQKT
jgi:hypothetical protein